MRPAHRKVDVRERHRVLFELVELPLMTSPNGPYCMRELDKSKSGPCLASIEEVKEWKCSPAAGYLRARNHGEEKASEKGMSCNSDNC